MEQDDVGNDSDYLWELINDLQAERDMYRDMVAAKDKKMDKCLNILKSEQHKNRHMQQMQAKLMARVSRLE